MDDAVRLRGLQDATVYWRRWAPDHADLIVEWVRVRYLLVDRGDNPPLLGSLLLDAGLDMSVRLACREHPEQVRGLLRVDIVRMIFLLEGA